MDAAEDSATVYGLRGTAGVDRANLAVVALPSLGSSIKLELRVFDSSGAPAPNVLTRTLAGGEWFQWNDVLGQAGLRDGTSGYARITRVGGSAPWTAYGILNDAVTSDGSVLPAFRPSGPGSARRLVVPSVVDVRGEAGSHYTTELTLANGSDRPTNAILRYQAAPGFGAPSITDPLEIPLRPGEQRIVPEVIGFLRDAGADPATSPSGDSAGTLHVEFSDLLPMIGGDTVAIARTTTPDQAGGRFGVGYSAVPWGEGARLSAIVPGLTQDARSRSNLAVVNVGGGTGGAPLQLRVTLSDAESGVAAGRELKVTLKQGEWFQWNRVLEQASLAGSHGIATIRWEDGDDTFFAYGVVNDAITSDGTLIRMIDTDN